MTGERPSCPRSEAADRRRRTASVPCGVGPKAPPEPSSRTRPRHAPRALVAASILAGVLGAAPAAAQDGDLADLALSLVNKARAAEGLPALEPGPSLVEAAETHAEDMLARDFYGHVGPDGATARDRHLDAGGSRWRIVAENIAKCEGCPTPAGPERVRAFQSGWMQSPGHRENILGVGLDRFGFGLASGDDAIYAVQMFAGPGTAPGAPPDETAARANQAGLQQAALGAVNAARRDAGLSQLEASEELNALAGALAEEVTFEGDSLSMPSDPFALLPEGTAGWTGLALAAEACGGCGAYPAEGDGAHFASGLAAGENGDRDFTHFGFVLTADGNGRKVAVGVFGRR